jgi:hypothetical protein
LDKPPTVREVEVSVKAPVGVGLTVMMIGVLTAQLPPVGVIVAVPEPTAFTVVPLIVATAGLELVRLVGEALHVGLIPVF